MELSPELMIAIVSGISGALVASLFNFVGNLLSRRAEDRRHFRQMVLNGAVESWKQYCSNCIAAGQTGFLLPIEVFILQMTKFVELVKDKRIDASDVAPMIRELEAFEMEIRKSFEESRSKFLREVPRR